MDNAAIASAVAKPQALKTNFAGSGSQLGSPQIISGR